MPKISDQQIAEYAIGAGLSKGSAATAVAVALAESGGNTTAHNRVPPDDSYGLWQINMRGKLGPDRRQRFGIRNEDLFDPAKNAKAMASISSMGTNWKDWSTYTSGAYRIYMNRGEKAAGTAKKDFIPDFIPTPELPENVDKLFGFFSNRNNIFQRIALFGVGLFLVYLVLSRIPAVNAAVSKVRGS